MCLVVVCLGWLDLNAVERKREKQFRLQPGNEELAKDKLLRSLPTKLAGSPPIQGPVEPEFCRVGVEVLLPPE